MDQPQSDSKPADKSTLPFQPTIMQLPECMKPREILADRGAEQLSDADLVAIILRVGLPGKNVKQLSEELLYRVGGLQQLMRSNYTELRRLEIKGLGKVKCIELAAAIEMANRAFTHQVSERPSTDPITNPARLFGKIVPLAKDLQQEAFWVILLDTKNKLIGQPEEITRGLLDSTQIHPREVFANAIRYRAAAVILAHNHPSGDPTPSSEDIAVTRRLIESARILGLKVLDHIIIGKASATSPGYASLRQLNLVNFS